MEAGACLQKGLHISIHLDAPLGRINIPRDQLEERALARPVATDDADAATSHDLQIDGAQRPERLRFHTPPRHQTRQP